MYILRVAVNGKTREELADHLIAIAEQFRNEKGMDLEDDNCGGGMETKHGCCDFDYQVFPQQEGEIVCFYPPDE